MISSQIERLQKDSSDLEATIAELRQVGDNDRMAKFVAKKDYLDNRLNEIMDVAA